MPGTKVQSTRTPIVVNGVGKYEIVSICVVPGSLPDTGIFLVNITDPAGPKSDVLLRVIELGDPSTYSNDRDGAILAGDMQWRSPEVRLVFDDIETANAAQKELSARINRLVTNFDSTNAEFTVVNEVVVYPAADSSAETEAKNAYVAARDAAAAAEVARDAELAVCAAKEVELTNVQVRLADAESDYATLTSAQLGLTQTNATYPTHRTTINTYVVNANTAVLGSSATPAEQTTITTYHSNIQLELQVMDATNATLNASITAVSNSTSALLGVLQARITTLTASETTLTLELQQCRVTSLNTQAAYTAAQAAEDAALAAVRVLCPDFDPNTV